jgi:polyketide biosynthesis enoyl-CoA hydratase PksI
MQDTAAKNSFSPALIEGLNAAFQNVTQSEDYKVVILTGYGNYFLSGGTKDELRQLISGTDTDANAAAPVMNLLHLIIDCPIPVIAAMQGHGIGAGFVLGLHADLVLLARESIYTTNFLKYGFTPGMGATLVVPAKFGPFLGNEMLYTARNYRGGELAERGVTCPVLPRAEVLPAAREMAQAIADAPRATLVKLKQALTANTHAGFYVQVAQEMSQLIATGQQPEIAGRIEARFGQ